MSGSVNKVILVGRLTRDPEVKNTQGGQKIVQLGLATNERWKDKNTGESKERTEFHHIVVFNENLGDVAERYLRKGSSCYVEGTLQTRKYNDRDGNERSTTEVVLSRFRGELVLLGGREEAGGRQGSFPTEPATAPRSGQGQGAGWRSPSAGKAAPKVETDLEDDVPW